MEINQYNPQGLKEGYLICLTKKLMELKVINKNSDSLTEVFGLSKENIQTKVMALLFMSPTMSTHKMLVEIARNSSTMEELAVMTYIVSSSISDLKKFMNDEGTK